MADLSITATSVVAGSNASIKHGTAGETVTAGQAGYYDASSRKYMKADSNSASAAARAAECIFLNGAAINQPVAVQTGGDITIGASLTAGVQYYLSDTPGGICPVADIGSGEYPCLVGLATSTSVLSLNFKPSGVAL
jgi:hypothetical protein